MIFKKKLPGKICAVKHEDVQISKLFINYATKHMVCIILHNITSGYLLNRLIISFNYQVSITNDSHL